jgi:hypothetical protein
MFVGYRWSGSPGQEEEELYEERGQGLGPFGLLRYFFDS